MPSDVNVSDELDLDFGASEPAAGSRSEPAAGSLSGPAARRRGSKGEQTRAVIVEAALRLFRENVLDEVLGGRGKA